jgi:hypothetical protein
MKTAVLGAITLSSLLLASTVHAQNLGETPVAAPASTFGNQGQVAISGDFNIQFTHRTEDEDSVLELAPAIDYFIAPQLSLGGQVLFGYHKNGPGSETAIGFGPRVGFNLALGPMFSLYPRLGFSYEHFTQSAGSVSASQNFLGLSAYAPFLWHPVPHFFIGLGPRLSGIVAGGESRDRFLLIELLSTVGGYFDW